MKKVVFIQRVLKKYRVTFFELLRSNLLQKGIELILIHGREGTKESLRKDAGFLNWATEIRNIYFPFGLLYQPCLKLTKDADLVIVEQANRYLLNYLLMIRKLFSKQKIAFLGHGITRQKKAGSLSNIFKKSIIKNVDWWFAYTNGVRRLIISRGFPEEKVTSFQNAFDTGPLIKKKELLTKEEILAVKERIGLGDGPVGIFCGGMYREKRVGFLLESCQRIKKNLPDFEMLFLGSGSDAYLVRDMARENKWMHYIGPCFEEEKVVYFMLSDLFLLPGLVGLAVLDSFALETPIITTKFPYHSPEVEYIQNGINGIITEDNLDSYVAAVREVLLNREKLNRLKKGCKESIGNYTVEKMVENFSRGAIECLGYER